ncbi:hypothetical protein Dsin_027946 [Dipteronia sinensis]|uniref:Hexosyltransferase n=1 Tax=Dipteronia sinensis TaxID=43782 RepID=A0AAD9ZPM7_9ROSI|nr:hypothetical protein Dsin_027946 [Dipteronia sinensis]
MTVLVFNLFSGEKMSFKRGGGSGEFGSSKNVAVFSRNWTLFLCVSSFCAGMFFTNRMWMEPEAKAAAKTSTLQERWTNLKSEDCNQKIVEKRNFNSSMGEAISMDQHDIQEQDKGISDIKIKMSLAKEEHHSVSHSVPVRGNMESSESSALKRKYFMVIGINTAFSSRKRRDSVRSTWMPQGEKRRKLEEEKGIVLRFVIGHSSTSGGILDRAIEAEEKIHGDFLRLNHIEGYLELSAKTKTYFATAVAMWDAEFYIKVDDDIHVNLGTLGMTLAGHRMKPRVYLGCMKSGPVLAKKGVKYHEPEYWKFGEVGNKYFRHATGQLYAISKDLATYISENQNILHKYANEDVSLGSWFIGLDVEHVDNRRLCCGTPPDCDWKAQLGNICVATFDWKCSGICKSVERIKQVHELCGESEEALWHSSF